MTSIRRIAWHKAIVFALRIVGCAKKKETPEEEAK